MSVLFSSQSVGGIRFRVTLVSRYTVLQLQPLWVGAVFYWNTWNSDSCLADIFASEELPGSIDVNFDIRLYKMDAGCSESRRSGRHH